jgi:hypothetical protein
MSGGYGYPPYAPPRAPVAVVRLVAAGLLLLAGTMALGGSFGALSVYRSESDAIPARTVTTTGWGLFEDPVREEPLPVPIVRFGIPLTAAAVLVLVVALLLVVSARRAGEAGTVRAFGVGGGGLLIGVVSVVWLQLVAIDQNVAASAEPGALGSGFRASYDIGVGGYLILAAAFVALAAAVLLLVPPRGAVAPTAPQPGNFPAFGPGTPPVWQPAPQHWPQPGPNAPPPGWGPPPPPHGHT